jgi:hypothetical protein
MEAVPGDFIVMFYEELEAALEVVENCRNMLKLKGKEKTPAELQEIAAG